MRYGSSVCMLLLVGLCAASAPSQADVTIFVGYADGVHFGSFFPDPWQGSPNTIFLGGGSSYDAGAIRIRNDGTQAVLLGQGAYVDGFSDSTSTRHQIWDSLIGVSGQSIAAGENLILTQTTSYDFDSSEFNNGGQHLNVQPVVHLTLNGTNLTYVDSGQILNTGDYDLGLNRNESNQWRPIGTTGINDPGGNPNAPAVPEPSTYALIASLGMTVAGFLVRRKRARKAL